MFIQQVNTCMPASFAFDCLYHRLRKYNYAWGVGFRVATVTIKAALGNVIRKQNKQKKKRNRKCVNIYC